MNLPLLVGLTFGALIIIVRAPFIFWPEATANFYRDKIFNNVARTRMLAVILFLMGLFMVLTTAELESGFAFFSTAMGLMLLAGSGVLVLIPDDINNFVTTMLDLFSNNFLRGIGVLSVAFAFVWIYASFIYFGN
jgi:hypothetical protein